MQKKSPKKENKKNNSTLESLAKKNIKNANKQSSPREMTSTPESLLKYFLNYKSDAILSSQQLSHDPIPAKIHPDSSPPNTEAISFRASSSKQNEGITQTAKLLLSLGPEHSSEILQHLSLSEIEAIISEISRISKITKEEKEKIFQNFKEEMREINEEKTQNAQDAIDKKENKKKDTNHSKEDDITIGGSDVAQSFIHKAKKKKKAEELTHKLNLASLNDEFSQLEKTSSKELASILNQESPQVIAVSLQFMQTKTASEVLLLLPEKIQNETLIRMSHNIQINPEAIRKVARNLSQKVSKKIEDNSYQIGGAQSIVNLLNHMDRKDEDKFLNILKEKNPQVMQEVSDMLYTFEEIFRLNRKEMQTLLSHINNDTKLVTAMRGIDPDKAKLIFNALSKNRAHYIHEEIERIGPLPIRKVEQARQEILEIAKTLDAEKLIQIKKENEEREELI